MTSISIAIVAYPGCLLSAVHGLDEMFWMANRASQELNQTFKFESQIVEWPNVHSALLEQSYAAIVLPPSREQVGNTIFSENLLDWLIEQHQKGALLSAACAGVFLLADTGLLRHKSVTTHWGLAQIFSQRFPDITLKSDEILINQGDIITAGGMMSWVDLGLELVAQFTSPAIMRQVGKLLVIDTGAREQRYYQQFSPSMLHGDDIVLQLQHWLHDHYHQSHSISELAAQAHVTPRTLQRRFIKAVGYNPIQYLQRLRIQKACDWLESSTHSFEWIAHQVGYDDAGACRKTFSKIMGLTPSEFRRRFTSPSQM